MAEFFHFRTKAQQPQQNLPTVVADNRLSHLNACVDKLTELILRGDLPDELEAIFIDLLDEKITERNKLQTDESVLNDPLVGWHLHQRSQSGFSLPPDPMPE